MHWHGRMEVLREAFGAGGASCQGHGEAAVAKELAESCGRKDLQGAIEPGLNAKGSTAAIGDRVQPRADGSVKELAACCAVQKRQLMIELRRLCPTWYNELRLGIVGLSNRTVLELEQLVAEAHRRPEPARGLSLAKQRSSVAHSDATPPLQQTCGRTVADSGFPMFLKLIAEAEAAAPFPWSACRSQFAEMDHDCSKAVPMVAARRREQQEQDIVEAPAAKRATTVEDVVLVD